MKHGAEILAELVKPGRQLFFVDDSGTSVKPLPDLAANFRLLCGALVQSELYGDIKLRIQDALRGLPIPAREFHATEIVNPNTRSVWKSMSVPERLAALESIFTLVQEHVEQALFCHVSKEQFDAVILPKLIASGSRIDNYEVALEEVFFKSIVSRVEKKTGLAAIVADSKVALADCLRIQELARSPQFLEGGVIYVDSHIEEGIQLADFIAFMLNRVHHVRQRALDGKANAFDEFFMRACDALRPRISNVLACDIE